MNALGNLLLLLPVLLVAACAPLYRAVPGEPVATLNVRNAANTSICVGGVFYRLLPDKDGNAAIPANRNLVVTSSYGASDGNMQYHCSPSVGFTPADREAYAANFEIRAERCRVMVYREDPTVPAGLVREPSVRRAVCN